MSPAPLTVAMVKKIAPRARSGLVGPTVDAINAYAAHYQVDTPLRLAHFLAQIIHESAGLTTFEELGGPRYFAKYDPNTRIGQSLGNARPGDGFRYRGRGPIQCTGLTNYRFYGQQLGIDLVQDPERAAEPAIGIQIAFAFWTHERLNAFADRDDVRGITRRVNGGLNGLADREHILALAKDALSVDTDTAMPVGLMASDAVELTPSAAIATAAPASMLSSREGWGAVTFGGVSLSEVGSYLHDYAADHLDIDGAVELVRVHPAILIWVGLVGLAVCIWLWRHQRMREA